MGNAKIGQYTTYRTSDLYLVAWLLSNGLELLDIDRLNKQRNDFIFFDRGDRSQLIRSFVCGRAVGNLPDFIYYLKKAKDLLYAG